MSATITEQTVHTLEIVKEEEIAAPIGLVFETLLEQIGPMNEAPDTGPMPMKFEAWPGGRWYRDLGNNSGHLWGHVQVIKPPTLLEIWGPLMMSYPSVNHLQYRFTVHGGGTQLAFVHRAMGLILPDHREGMPKGWAHWIEKIRERAERKTTHGKK
jgi:Activator of Hsp90 ATPase homolog 1-like protein